MNSSTYWDNQYRNLMNNQPQKASSYYNQSFVDKINDAQKNIDNLVKEKDKSWSSVNQRQDDYDSFYGGMKKYGDVYKESENEFGVKNAQDNYEKSKKALALAESTLNALPSTINASSNRVLSQSQRESAYNTLADRAVRQRDAMQNRSSAYEDVWKNARQNQSAYAQAEMSSQWSKLGDYNNAFKIATDKYMDAEKRLMDSKLEKSTWQSEYRSWQYRQYGNAQSVWLGKMTTALNRYMQALNTEMTLKETEADKSIAYSNAQIAQRNQEYKSNLAESLVNNYQNRQQARNSASVANAGGFFGRLAYLSSR